MIRALHRPSTGGIHALLAAILLMLGVTTGTAAQERWPISLEANIGPGGGRTSAPAWNPDGYLYRSTRGTGAEVLLAVRAGSIARLAAWSRV
jgi:hypothetical protein